MTKCLILSLCSIILFNSSLAKGVLSFWFQLLNLKLIYTFDLTFWKFAKLEFLKSELAGGLGGEELHTEALTIRNRRVVQDLGPQNQIIGQNQNGKQVLAHWAIITTNHILVLPTGREEVFITQLNPGK